MYIKKLMNTCNVNKNEIKIIKGNKHEEKNHFCLQPHEENKGHLVFFSHVAAVVLQGQHAQAIISSARCMYIKKRMKTCNGKKRELK
jgi:hypothetical protein